MYLEIYKTVTGEKEQNVGLKNHTLWPVARERQPGVTDLECTYNPREELDNNVRHATGM